MSPMSTNFFQQTASPTVPMSQKTPMAQMPQLPQARNLPNQYQQHQQPNYQLPISNNMNLLMANPTTTNKTSGGKQVQLSAQEINDFLS